MPELWLSYPIIKLAEYDNVNEVFIDAKHSKMHHAQAIESVVQFFLFNKRSGM